MNLDDVKYWYPISINNEKNIIELTPDCYVKGVDSIIFHLGKYDVNEFLGIAEGKTSIPTSFKYKTIVPLKEYEIL